MEERLVGEVLVIAGWFKVTLHHKKKPDIYIVAGVLLSTVIIKIIGRKKITSYWIR